MVYHHMRRPAVSAGRPDSRNRLESGEIRVNMLTRRFAFVPLCGATVPFNLVRVNNCFLESNQQLPDWNV